MRWRPWLALLGAALGDVEPGVFMVQMQATHVARTARTTRTGRRHEVRQKPWEVHQYLACAHHKSGVDLTKKLVWFVFGELGVFGERGETHDLGLMTRPCGPGVCYNPEAPVRIEVDMCSAETVQQQREAAGPGVLKVVVPVRDPLEMVASAYCFHHEWKEWYNPIAWPLGVVPSMDAQDGVAFMAHRMLPQVANMSSFAEPQNDTFRIDYEKFTRSSKDFDEEARKLIDFWFAGLITEEEHGRVLEAAKKADLRRVPDVIGHTNSEECMSKARKATRSMPADLQSRYEEFRSRLGYNIHEDLP